MPSDPLDQPVAVVDRAFHARGAVRPSDVLAALTDEQRKELRRRVWQGVSNYCGHAGPVLPGDECCADCSAIVGEVMWRLGVDRAA